MSGGHRIMSATNLPNNTNNTNGVLSDASSATHISKMSTQQPIHIKSQFSFLSQANTLL